MLLMLAETLETEERQKFEDLYDEYHLLLLVYARSIVKSDSLAEDAVQEAYLRVLKNLHKINPEKRKETKAYLVTILKNVSIDLYHRHVKVKEASLDELFDLPQDEHIDPTWRLYDISELANDMKRWIGCLSKDEQTLMIYRIHYQWTYDQIASALGIKSSTASSKVCRARNKLIAMYEKERGKRNG